MSKKTRRVKVVDNTLFVQVTDAKKGKDGVWRQRTIEQELGFFYGTDYEPEGTSQNRGIDLEILKERYNA